PAAPAPEDRPQHRRRSTRQPRSDERREVLQILDLQRGKSNRRPHCEKPRIALDQMDRRTPHQRSVLPRELPALLVHPIGDVRIRGTAAQLLDVEGKCCILERARWHLPRLTRHLLDRPRSWKACPRQTQARPGPAWPLRSRARKVAADAR